MLVHGMHIECTFLSRCAHDPMLNHRKHLTLQPSAKLLLVVPQEVIDALAASPRTKPSPITPVNSAGTESGDFAVPRFQSWWLIA